MNKPTTDGAAITCFTCKACCCKLEVILMNDDDPPDEFIARDQWGGQVMRRLDDGWCAAVDRTTMLCRIYERRPGVCREFAVGESACLTERSEFDRERRIVLMDASSDRAKRAGQDEHDGSQEHKEYRIGDSRVD